MQIFAVFVRTWAKGLTIATSELVDPESDSIELNNTTDKPVVITFFGTDPITYEGVPVESLELAPNSIFVGSAANGNIAAKYGALTPIPRVNPVDVLPPFTHLHIIEGFNETLATDKEYRKLQRQAINALTKVVKTLK